MSDSLVQVVRTMVEAATSETLAFLVKIVNESLKETKHLRDNESGESKLLPLVNVTGILLPPSVHESRLTYVIDRELPEGNKDLRRLITLHLRVMLLSDIYSTAGYAQGRASATLLQALTSPEAGDMLPELGSLHRSCLWENIMLKNAESANGTKSAEVAHDDNVQIGNGATISFGSVTVPVAETNGSGNLLRPPFVVPSQTPSSEGPPSDSDPRASNCRVMQQMTSQLPNTSLLPFFQGKWQWRYQEKPLTKAHAAVVRLFQTRRNPDASHKQRIMEASSVVADVLLGHLALRSAGKSEDISRSYIRLSETT